MYLSKRLLLVICSMLMVSCSSSKVAIEEPKTVFAEQPKVMYEKSEPRITMSSPVPVAEMIIENFILFKSFLYPKDQMSKDLINMIYLPKKPTTDQEVEHYTSICNIWLDSFPTKEEIQPYTDPTKDKLVPLYWPLTKKLNDLTCSSLIENYDYGRMSVYAKHNKLDINKVQLIAEYKQVFVTMDLSGMHNEESLAMSFNVWKDKMCKLPNKNAKIEVTSLVFSLKRVLGLLGGLVNVKMKG